MNGLAASPDAYATSLSCERPPVRSGLDLRERRTFQSTPVRLESYSKGARAGPLWRLPVLVADRLFPSGEGIGTGPSGRVLVLH